MAWKDIVMKIKMAYKDECIFSIFETTPSFMLGGGNSTPSDKSKGEEDEFTIVNAPNVADRPRR